MNTREIVLDLLLAINEEKKLSHLALADTFSKYPELEKTDRAFVKILCEGTIERKITLDYIIGHFATVKITKMKPLIRNLLRLSVYQLYYMKVPASAVCNEAVKIAKKRGFTGLSGFVNGTLRAIARSPMDLQEKVRGLSKTEQMSVLYSVPEFIVRNLCSWYGEATAVKILEAFLEKEAVTVRVNTSCVSVKECKKELEQSGVIVQQSNEIETALCIRGYSSLSGVPAFRKGWITVQDTSSMLPVLAAGIKKGDYVIDCCAAPGGKSLHAADLLQGTGMVSARDVSERKIKKIEENRRRMNFCNVTTLVADATILRKEDIGTADVLLADLPCSGLGIIGKKPDIKYNISEESFCELAKLQRTILDVVSQYVKPGGVMIFSTCTMNPAENTENVKYITEKLGFVTESLNEYIPKVFQNETTASGYLQLFPKSRCHDGFFVSRFRRVK